MSLLPKGLRVWVTVALLLGPALGVVAGTTPAAAGGASVRIPSGLRRPERPGTPPPSIAPGAATEADVKSALPPSTLKLVKSGEGETLISMGLYGVDIDHLLTMLSTAANVTIVKSEQVTGSVTIIAPEAVPLDVAFQILDSVLEVRGFAIVRSPTGIYKIVPMADAMKSSVPIYFGQRPEDVEASDSLITQVIPLTNLDATSVIGEIRLLLSQNASVVPTAANSIIITDIASNIERVLQIIADGESQLSGGLQVFRLQYRDVQEVASLVSDIVLGRGAGRGGVRPAWEQRVQARPTPARQLTPQSAAGVGGAAEFCYPDVRTNSLIVLATPTHLQQIDDLVQKLDVPISLRDSYFVYPVQNLVASDLAQLIAPLVNAQVTTATGAGRATGTAAARAATGRVTGTAARATTRSTSSTVRRSSARQADPRTPRPAAGSGAALEVEPLAGVAGSPIVVAQAPEGAVQVAPVPALPTTEAPYVVMEPQGDEVIAAAAVGDALIAADDNSNILLISASSEKLELIQQLLEELDVLPPQVNIRAIIAEVSLDRETSLGFQWSRLPQLGPYGGQGVVGDFVTSFGLSTEGALGLFGQISAADFQGVLTALTTDSKARILSTPSIFTSNNQPASINVSSSRPFPTGQLASTAGTSEGVAGVISTTFRYDEVGIQLNVTPLVTQGDVVRMEIQVFADEPGAPVDIGGESYPSTNMRQASAIVHVKNGYTVILGGLMRESISRRVFRVPLLGDLPIIGPLFRKTTSTRTKSELLVFLTPQVVRSVGEALQLTDEYKQHLSDIPRMLQAPPPGMAQESAGPSDQPE